MNSESQLENLCQLRINSCGFFPFLFLYLKKTIIDLNIATSDKGKKYLLNGIEIEDRKTSASFSKFCRHTRIPRFAHSCSLASI